MVRRQASSLKAGNEKSDSGKKQPLRAGPARHSGITAGPTGGQPDPKIKQSPFYIPVFAEIRKPPRAGTRAGIKNRSPSKGVFPEYRRKQHSGFSRYRQKHVSFPDDRPGKHFLPPLPRKTRTYCSALCRLPAIEGPPSSAYRTEQEKGLFNVGKRVE